MPERLAVVGVGASAGGLAAVSALVRALPADAPLAVVIVQHLDSVRGSNLVELLARHSAMQVKTASEGDEVRAGRIYVIPPAADLRIDSGRLRLVPRETTPAPHLPIDDFFASLAAERATAAMGVVLSGTGSDGAAGVRALKAAGAVTFAQDATAQHPGMPEAAVATGCVDAVGPPEQIAARLLERARDLVHVDARRIDDDLTNVLSSVGIAMLLLGRDSRIRRFTPEAGRLMNLLATDVGRPLSDIDSTLHVPDLLATVHHVLASLVPREQTITDKTGRWFKLTVRPYVTMDSRIDGTVLSIVDVDTIKRGEALLGEARDYAESIVATIRQPLVVLDGERRVVSANRAFFETFGMVRANVAGRPFVEVGNFRFAAPGCVEILERLARGEGVDDVQCELDVPRVGQRTMLVSGRPMPSGGGDGHVALLAFSDVTEQLKADAQVRRSEKALRDMLAAASEAILIADEKGTITFANTMAARTFGYTPDELVGSSIETLVPEASRGAHPGHRAAFHAAGKAAPTTPGRDISGRRKDGSVFPIEATLSTMEGEHGRLAVAFISDITERKANEARIAKYKQNLQEMAFDAAIVEEKQRRRIAAGLHDNIGQTLALAQLRLNEVRASAGKAVREDLDRCMAIIAQAISDTRSLTFELSPPVLYDLGLPAAVAWLGEQLEKQHGLRVSVVGDDAVGRLDDETASLLFRAVRELLANVVKHAKTTEATVSMRLEGHSLALAVEDHGGGFDPVRVGTHDATQTFGLFSVREQITRLGGSFEIDSGAEHGTKITLRVPISKRSSVPPPPSGETS